METLQRIGKCFHPQVSYARRYYNNPFRTKDLVDGKGLDKMCSSYLDGLCWVLNYYLQGPPSWKWFYPFHYSPCASDLLAAIENLSSTTHSITYHHDYSSPLKPVEQLLCVLPAESAAALPVACRGLMTSKSSPLSDIYHPQDVVTDRGNPMSWLWIILLPFIDVNRIIRAAKECEPLFTPEETLRNTYGTAFLYVNSLQCNNIASSIDENLLANETSPKDDLRDCLSSNIRTDGEVVVYPLYGFVSHSPIYEGGYSSEDGDADHDDDEEESERILCFQYFLPTETIHRSALIEGIQPLGSPLDLKSNRKKNNRFRGGGRSRGRGGRGSRGRSDHRSHGDVRGGEGHDVSEFHEGGNRKNGRGGGRGSNHSHPHSSHHQG